MRPRPFTEYQRYAAEDLRHEFSCLASHRHHFVAQTMASKGLHLRCATKVFLLSHTHNARTASTSGHMILIDPHRIIARQKARNSRYVLWRSMPLLSGGALSYKHDTHTI